MEKMTSDSTSNNSSFTPPTTPTKDDDEAGDDACYTGTTYLHSNKYETNEMFSNEFLLKIPKTDLHCHLDGSVRVGTLIDLHKEQNLPLPYDTADDLNKHVFKDTYDSLEEYLMCFGYVMDVLRDPGALERVSYEFAVDQYDVGVRYFECRFAPQLNAIPDKLSVEDVLIAVNKGLSRATKEYNARKEILEGFEPEYDYGIIVCAMRFFEPTFSPYYKLFWEMHKHEDPHTIYSLASMSLITTSYAVKMDYNIPIVALDVAGAEEGFPAETHTDAFAFAHKKFINKTVHAGEGYGPESIFQAITDLHAQRIGHGVHLFNTQDVKAEKNLEDREAYVNSLSEFIGNNRICLEVCLSSNLQTIPTLQNDLSKHPFQQMLDRRLACTLCTDNRTVSKTSIVNELRLAADAFQLTPYQMKELIIQGFKHSFMNRPYVEKRMYNHSVISYYDKLAREYNVTMTINSDNKTTRSLSYTQHYYNDNDRIHSPTNRQYEKRIISLSNEKE